MDKRKLLGHKARLPIVALLLLSAASIALVQSSPMREPETMTNQPTSSSSTTPLSIMLDEGLLSGSTGVADERHHYEQTGSGSKPEPRNTNSNHISEEQFVTSTGGEHATVILDHRPSEPIQQVSNSMSGHQNDQLAATTQSPVSMASQPNAPQQQQTFALQSQQQQPQQVPQQSWLAPQQQQTVLSFAPAMVQPQPQPLQQQQPQQQQQQFPNSINAIINATPDQLQQSQAQTQPVVMQVSGSQQAPVVSLNGQPMILVNPNALNGHARRISISGWLKGLSSMLASIFNRRDHGQLFGQQQAGANGLGLNWLQLSPSGSSVSQHWLQPASAQSQHYTGTRFAFLAPQQQPQAGTGGSSAGQNGGLQDLLASGSSPTTTFVAIQAPTQPQQQPQQQLANLQYQTTGTTQAISISAAPSAQAARVEPARSAQTGNGGQSNWTLSSSVVTSNAVVASPTVQPTTTTITTNPQPQQQRTQRPNGQAATSGGHNNLPLAHYSRYAVASD